MIQQYILLGNMTEQKLLTSWLGHEGKNQKEARIPQSPFNNIHPLTSNLLHLKFTPLLNNIELENQDLAHESLGFHI